MIMSEVNKVLPPVDLGAFAGAIFGIDREFAVPVRAKLLNPGVLRVSVKCRTPDCFVKSVEP